MEHQGFAAFDILTGNSYDDIMMYASSYRIAKFLLFAMSNGQTDRRSRVTNFLRLRKAPPNGQSISVTCYVVDRISLHAMQSKEKQNVLDLVVCFWKPLLSGELQNSNNAPQSKSPHLTPKMKMSTIVPTS